MKQKEVLPRLWWRDGGNSGHQFNLAGEKATKNIGGSNAKY
jgi:hypothetical protein